MRGAAQPADRGASRPAAHRGRRRRGAVDVRGAMALVGQMLAYLSVSTLFPTAVAIGYGEPFWPFLAAA